MTIMLNNYKTSAGRFCRILSKFIPYSHVFELTQPGFYYVSLFTMTGETAVVFMMLCPQFVLEKRCLC